MHAFDKYLKESRLYFDLFLLIISWGELRKGDS